MRVVLSAWAGRAQCLSAFVVAEVGLREARVAAEQSSRAKRNSRRTRTDIVDYLVNGLRTVEGGKMRQTRGNACEVMQECTGTEEQNRASQAPEATPRLSSITKETVQG